MKWCLQMAHSLTAAWQSCWQKGRCGRHTLCVAWAAHTGRTGPWPWKGRCLRLQWRMLMACRPMLLAADAHANGCVVVDTALFKATG